MHQHQPVDPFITAWGEVESWRGAVHQAQALTTCSPELATQDPSGVWEAARALGQGQALRVHVLAQIDRLLPTVRLPWLHRAFTALRWARRGPSVWKRAWWGRAVSLSALVAEERLTLRAARAQVAAWQRAVRWASEGVAHAQAHPWSLAPPGESGSLEASRPPLGAVGSEVEGLRQALEHVQADLGHVSGRLGQLATALARLEGKVEAIGEVGRSCPLHPDALAQSDWFKAAVASALLLPLSQVPGSCE